MTIALARRYRRRRFADLVVQDHVVAALRGALAKGRVGHGYLLTGPRGVAELRQVLPVAQSRYRREDPRLAEVQDALGRGCWRKAIATRPWRCWKRAMPPS